MDDRPGLGCISREIRRTNRQVEKITNYASSLMNLIIDII